MKKVRLIYIPSLLLGTLSSCSDVWDGKTNNEWEPKYIWIVSEVAQGVLNSAYRAIPNRLGNYGNNFLDAATNNVLINLYNSSIHKLAAGKYSAIDNPLGIWSTCYQQLQYINSFLENGLDDKTEYDKINADEGAAYKKRLKGKAYSLRASWGFRMLRQYGGKTDDGKALGYPLALYLITEEGVADLTSFERDTYQKYAEQIMADCDMAIECLPTQYSGDDPVLGVTEVGRVAQLTAATLKSRTALYVASSASQPDALTKINEMGDFTVKDVAAYTEKRVAATMIADEVLKMDDFGNFYGLKATDLADAGNTTPAEFLFRTYFNSRDLENKHFASYYSGKANTVPSQNLVDAFPMKMTGYPISDTQNSAYDPENPYDGRDNRLYLNIYYQGAAYGKTGLPVDTVCGGRDSQSYDPFTSRSGYYLAKFLSRNEAVLDPLASTNAQHYYPIFRKAEVFLSYAEAVNEAWGLKGKDPNGICKFTAYQVIKTIHQTSGGITDTKYLDEMATSKESFRILIQNERRSELASENQRYYDMRRWLLPLNEAVKGVVVTKEGGDLIYTSQKVGDRKFDGIHYYYSPLPYCECMKNPNLVNNLGWKQES